MTAKEAFFTILLSILGFACLGGLAGLFVNFISPAYYVRVFHIDPASGMDGSLLGLQLGAFQGSGVGVIFALGALGLGAYRELFSQQQEKQNASLSEQSTRKWRVLLWLAWTLIVTVVVSVISIFLGVIMGELGTYERQTRDKMNQLTAILETGNYPDLTPDSSGKTLVYLVGTVPSKEVRHTLFDQLIKTFGTETAETMIEPVDVKQALP